MSADLVERTRALVREALVRDDRPEYIDAFCWGWLSGALTNHPSREIPDVLRGVLAARAEVYAIADQRAAAVTR